MMILKDKYFIFSFVIIVPFDTSLFQQFENTFPLDSFVYVSSVVMFDSFVLEKKLKKIHLVYRQTNGRKTCNQRSSLEPLVHVSFNANTFLCLLSLCLSFPILIYIMKFIRMLNGIPRTSL